MVARAACNRARDRLAGNGAEDPPSASPARFRERGRLPRRAASGFPGLRILSPEIGPAPRSASRALPKVSPGPEYAFAARAAAPEKPQTRPQKVRTQPKR